MNATVFVDTNVFIYAIDNAEKSKQQAAGDWRIRLWQHRLGRVSFQVLQEFYVKAVHRWPAARDVVRDEIRDLLAWQPVAIEAGTIDSAWKVQDRYQISFWDALIVAAAKSISCGYLLTEDLQHEQNLDGVVVINPFRCSPDSLPR